MARATAPTTGAKADPTLWPTAINTDYVSQTDTNAQTVGGDLAIAGNLTVTGSYTFGAHGLASGSSPITVAHGLSGVTSSNTVVLLCARAAQPYTLAYDIGAVNITIRHNAASSLTVSWHAFKI